MSENTVLGVKKRPQGTYDVLLDLKEPAAVSASAAGTSKLYIGTGLYKACAILDVESIATTADGLFDIVIQGSTDEAFTAANVVELASLSLGHKSGKRTDSDKTDEPGRYKIYFDNENNGIYYPYVRIYTAVGGTTDTSITYSAYLVPME